MLTQLTPASIAFYRGLASGLPAYSASVLEYHSWNPRLAREMKPFGLASGLDVGPIDLPEAVRQMDVGKVRGVVSRLWEAPRIPSLFQSPPSLLAAIRRALRPLPIPPEGENREVLVPAPLYNNPYGRTASEVMGGLLKLEDTHFIFDAGGGLSLYGLEMALRGIRVMTVNAQDFYGDLLTPLRDPEVVRNSTLWGQRTDYCRVEKIGGLLVPYLDDLARILEIPLPEEICRPTSFLWKVHPRWKRLFCFSFAGWAAEVMNRLENMREQFIRTQGYVQSVLPFLPAGSADRVFDFFGAHYYSHNGMALLAAYYRLLKEWGKAYVVIPFLKPLLLELGAVSEESLYDFLLKRYSDFFSVHSTRGHELLALTRLPGREFPEELLRFSMVEKGFHAGSSQEGHTLPFATYRVFS